MSEAHGDGLKRKRDGSQKRRGKELQSLLLRKSQQEGSRSDTGKDFLPGKVPALRPEGEGGEQDGGRAWAGLPPPLQNSRAPRGSKF